MELINMLVDIIIVILLVSGIFFFTMGVIGLIRFPDVYSRMHATTKCDTLGTGLVLLALILAQPLTVASAKIFFIILFIWITNPTTAHIIAKAAYKTDISHSDETEIVDHVREE